MEGSVSSPVRAEVGTMAIDAAMDSQSDSKLKYVIIFGAPLIAGVALYWYMRRRKGNALSKNSAGSSGVQKSDTRAVSQKKVDEQMKSQKERATGYKDKGNRFFRNNRFKAAIESYSEGIKVCPVNETEMLSIFYQNRAASYEKLQMFDNVIQDCNKAIELNKRYSKAYLRRAKAWEQRGELRKCLEDATFSCMINDFKDEQALQLVDKMLKLFGAQQAKEIYHQRKPSLPSSPYIRNFLRSFSEDPVILDLNAKRNNVPQQKSHMPPSGYDLALQDLQDEIWDAVEAHCSEEIEKDQNKEKVDKALILRAGFSLITGKVTEAMKDVENLLSRENVDIKVRVNGLIKKATVELHFEKTEEALATFQKAVDLDPNNADIYLHRGQVYLLLDQLDQTVKNFATASFLKPDFVSPNVQLAYTEYRAGTRFNDRAQQNAGRKKFNECLKKFPNDSEVLFLYAQLMMGLEKYDSAEKYLNELIEIHPQDSAGFVHLGIIALQARKDIRGAVALMKTAIENDPKCQLAYETLGTLYIQTGQMVEGIALLDKGIAMAQTEAEIAHLIGLKTTAEIQMSASKKFGTEVPLFSVPLAVN